MPTALRNFLKTIPLPVGPLWYLVAYRWLLVAGVIVAVGVTWNLWQVRSGPANTYHPLLPAGADVTDFAPMMPVADWLPQINLAWWMIGSALLVLVRPWWGIIAHTAVVIVGMLLDQTRIQHYHQTMFLLWGTLPSLNCQMVARANLIAMWFWAGLHKLCSENFREEIAYQVLTTIFPPVDYPAEAFPWITPDLGYFVGWGVGFAEMGLGILCLIPQTRKLAACIALPMHVGIFISLQWISQGWASNVGPWNIELALAGFVLIAPWREAPWVSWLKCRSSVRVLVIFLLVYPAGFYANVVDAYLSHCIYVKNSPEGVIVRNVPDPGKTGTSTEYQLSIHNYGTGVVNVPLPPAHRIFEEFFNKVRQPGDRLVIRDPRPWAKRSGIHYRELTDAGELRDGKPHGYWIRRDAEGNKLSEGMYARGVQNGPWVFYYPDGQKEMAGNYVNGKEDGAWTTWTPAGVAERVEFRSGELVP